MLREKIKNIPILGKILSCIYFYTVKVYMFVTHKLLRQYISQSRWKKIRREIVRDFSDSEDEEIKELAKNIREQSIIRTFNYPFYEKYSQKSINVLWDQENGGYPYVMHDVNGEDKKLYFPVEWNDKRIIQSYRQLLVEQDPDSPHCYRHEDYEVKENAIVLDLGVAEGNFSVGIVDKAKHVYLFEGDSIWMEPLKLTFENWKEKITIIPKYVSDFDDDHHISLQSFLTEKNFNNETVFVKMDIEGYEENVLNGCSPALAQMINQVEGSDITIAVCCYHKQDSEKEIRNIISKIGFKKIESSKGFLILNNFCEKRIYPYFRRGILFASNQEKS